MKLETGNSPSIPVLTHEQLADVHTIIIKPEGVLFSFLSNPGALHPAYYYTYFKNVHWWLRGQLGSGGAANAMMNNLQEGPFPRESWESIFSKEFGVDRKRIEDFTWNISPDGLIEVHQSPINAIHKLKGMGKRIVLFSHLHQTWMNNILQYMRVTKDFELRCTDDMYPNPAEALRGLYYGIDLSRTALVASFIDDDYVGAHNAGMQVFRHKTHTALIRLVNGTQ